MVTIDTAVPHAAVPNTAVTTNGSGRLDANETSTRQRSAPRLTARTVVFAECSGAGV
jgi:hypothetical protein